MFRLDRLLFVLPFVFMLVACNLSAGSSVPTESASLVVTATSPSATTDEPEVEQENEDDSTDETVAETERITTDNTGSQQVVNSSSSSSSVSAESESSDLYYVRGTQLSGQCTVQAEVNTNIRTWRSTSSEIVGQLIGGEWIPVVRMIDGWYQIDLSGTPVHRMWISSDPTDLDSRCRCELNGCDIGYSVRATPIVDPGLYYAGNPQPYPPVGCFVYTVGDFPVNIRTGRSETASRIGQLRANQWLPVDSVVNGWFGVHLPGTPIDGAYISNGPVYLSSNCQCDEFSCQQTAPSTATCDITTYVDSPVTNVHVEPANWSRTVGQLVAGEVYRAIAESTSGWYQLEIGGWVAPNYIRRLVSGACQNLPKIEFGHPRFDCELVNTIGEIQTIYTEPNGEYYGRFPIDMQLGLIKRDGDWYQVYVPAFNSAGWVNGSAMRLADNCAEFE